MQDLHDSRDETLIINQTAQRPVVELSASAQGRLAYKTPWVVRALRWLAAPFSEGFDHERRGTVDRRQAVQRNS